MLCDLVVFTAFGALCVTPFSSLLRAASLSFAFEVFAVLAIRMLCRLYWVSLSPTLFVTSQILLFHTFPAVFVISLACAFPELFAFIVSATVYVLLVFIGFVVSHDPCIFFVLWFSVPTLTIYTFC